MSKELLETQTQILKELKKITELLESQQKPKSILDNLADELVLLEEGEVKVNPFQPFDPTTPYDPTQNPEDFYFPQSGWWHKAIEKLPELQKITCTKCGVDWTGTMCYSCPDMNCPIQPKITC